MQLLATSTVAALLGGAAALQASPSAQSAPTLEKPERRTAEGVWLNNEGHERTQASAKKSDADLLIRAARGEAVERTPVWLMRQAGRYMADFRAYSDKYPFRMRSETPEMATELSLQCWRAFGVDGVILFSDILTPLPAMGVEFDVVKGRGPLIEDTLRTGDRIAAFAKRCETFNPEADLAFTGETLRNLRRETEGKTSLIGFVGAPWTLAAYATEGGASKHALHMKSLMRDEPALAHQMLAAMAETIGTYAIYQIDQGAQMIQLFESWSHQLSPAYFAAFAKPYANRVVDRIKAVHPDVPVLFFANGGSPYLDLQADMLMNTGGASFDGLSLDWAVDMRTARSILGENAVLQGNVDPTVLLGSPAVIEAAVKDCIDRAGQHHILNLGHGVLQQTPEASVAAFVDACKKHGVHQQ